MGQRERGKGRGKGKEKRKGEEGKGGGWGEKEEEEGGLCLLGEGRVEEKKKIGEMNKRRERRL